MDLERTWGRMESFESLVPGEDVAPRGAREEPGGSNSEPLEEEVLAGVRALGRIREQEDDERGLRRWVATLLGAAVLSASAAGLAVAFGEEAKDAVASEDPLDALEALASHAGGAAASKKPLDVPDGEGAGKTVPPVDPAELSFPRALLDEPGGGPLPAADAARPEVAVAMASAAAELEALDEEFGAPGGTMNAAALASGDVRVLERAAEADPLVAAALPEPGEGGQQVPAGRPGRYSLHVASYSSPDEAHVFAEALRARGHAAFVRKVDLGERGLRWRVQIGPFERLGRVRAYARRFESQEDIHPIVLREERP